jgi:hypothetical protein
MTSSAPGQARSNCSQIGTDGAAGDAQGLDGAVFALGDAGALPAERGVGTVDRTFTWSGWPDLNRRPLRPELRVHANSAPGPGHTHRSDALKRRGSRHLPASDRT